MLTKSEKEELARALELLNPRYVPAGTRADIEEARAIIEGILGK